MTNYMTNHMPLHEMKRQIELKPGMIIDWYPGNNYTHAGASLDKDHEADFKHNRFRLLLLKELSELYGKYLVRYTNGYFGRNGTLLSVWKCFCLYDPHFLFNTLRGTKSINQRLYDEIAFMGEDRVCVVSL